MKKHTVRRLRGAVELATDGVEAAATEAWRAHSAIARRPYAWLSRIGPIAGPVRIVERVHVAVMDTAYGGVRVFNALAAAVAAGVFDRLERPRPR